MGKEKDIGKVGNSDVVEIRNDDVIEYQPSFNRPYDVEYKRIDEVLNLPILIKDIVVEKYNDREIIHVLYETLDGKEFATRTSSSVLLKQLKQFEQLLKSGKKLKAKIVRRKRYYTLAPPQ
ncbi:MAG: hypothetical protein QXP36_03790 [Conexivisphaerales archaeon]